MKSTKMNRIKTEETHDMLSFQYVADVSEKANSWNFHQVGIICSIVLATFAAFTFPYFFISLPIATVAMTIGLFGLGDPANRTYAILGIVLSLAVCAASACFIALIFAIGIPS